VLQASFDLTPLTLEQIKNNALSMSVDQQPFMQGYMAIIELDLKSRFDLSPADVNTGVALVDKTGINQLAELVKKGVR
jgi:simple sugar transport system substrate-binding protein